MAHADISARILGALSSPMTTDELVRDLGELTKPVREAVGKLHRRGQIHIEGWDVTGTQLRARWIAGHGPDAPRPRRVWETEKEAA